ncbi:MAG: sacsin N-terminal ATP-binding-like domain-containing protein [Phocaeicola sp.]
MSNITNRSQLQRATDEEIEKFFVETTFEGIYSSEVKSTKKAELFKGHISNIKLNGSPTNITPMFLNVPVNSNEIPEGACSFKCRMNISLYRSDSTKYFVNLVGRSLQERELQYIQINKSQSESSKVKDLCDMWGVDDCQLIGFYRYDEESEIYVVDDLRKPNFSHLPYYPGDIEKNPIRITYPYEIKGIEQNSYYLFSWKLSGRNSYNPYEIQIDFNDQPKPIDPKWFVDTLFNDRHNDKSKNFDSATNFLDTLSKQLSAKESTFVYELLQNANDYPVEGKKVDVEFHITDNYLLFCHSGERFNVRNISGICGINEKEKSANKKAIGYKGIGFKTVFLNNHYVYIRTGDYSFRFDCSEQKIGGKIRRLEAPWPILPIWTEPKEISREVSTIFDEREKKFHVQIALRPDNNSLLHLGNNCYENLFKELFSDANIILFIPEINSVRVYINGKEERVCHRNSKEWVVDDFEKEISVELQEAINKTIDKGNSRIPEKYKDFDCTKISFACKHDKGVVKPIDNATLYCYLPTKASWGFPFLLNTDMIPKGDRNDIETEVQLLDGEDTNFNVEIASIAGEQLFYWIRKLLTSMQYNLGSVFSLVPDFKKCKKEHSDYDAFISSFEDSFNTQIETLSIVPVENKIVKVSSVVYDTTGLTTSGIMTDEEFYEFTEFENCYLPLKVIRKDKRFVHFLKRYAEDEQEFSIDSLHDLVENEDFQQWLKRQDNNNKFLNFLLEKEYLEEFLDEEIFLEVDGNLYAANQLFYDIDKYLIDLNAFASHLYYLSPQTRAYFNGNEKWNKIVADAFEEFNCDDFINNVLLSNNNIDDTVYKLEDKSTSLHFYKFLSENVGYCVKYLSLPFINDSDEVVDNFENKFIFISSQKGHKVCESEWMSEITIEFLSDDYSVEAKNYFKDNFTVREYSDEIIMTDIVLNDEYLTNIAEGINEDFDNSKAFVDYCYQQKEFVPSASLRQYALQVYDSDGDEQWCLTEDHIFFESDLYDNYSSKAWLDCGWMYALNKAYYSNQKYITDFRKFLSQSFRVKELSNENFYKEVIKTNIEEITANISGTSDYDGSKNADFIAYLDDNYQLIFDLEKDSEVFSGLILCQTDCSDVNVSEPNLYIYDNELVELVENEWFPEDVVCICHQTYGNSKALAAIGVKCYNFSKFFDDVIVP